MKSSDQNILRTGTWESVVNFLHRLIEPLVSVALFFMMTLTFADVIGRYIFNKPITGALELTEFFMAIVIFLGLVLLTSEEGHVTVDLLDSFIPEKVKAIQKIIINIINLTIMSIISWQLWIKAGEAAEYGDRTEYLQLPLPPLIYFMSIMVGISSLILLLILIKSLKMEK
ncbi:MAG: TRAP transporter small permease [Desulfobacteraceae bacterium]|nr:TRAP transporter small permease [Desulfobacteraceae bacterium]